MTFSLIYFIGAAIVGIAAMAHAGSVYGGGEEAASNAYAALLIALLWPVIAVGVVLAVAVAVALATMDWVDS